MLVVRKSISCYRFLLFMTLGSLSMAQIPAFCPPAGAKVDPPITLVDDLCNAPPLNSYRLQEQSAPLSFKQKAGYYVQNKVFSASAIFGAVFFAEIAQVRNDPPEWPKGVEGFGRRFGTRYAQSLTKSTAEFLFGFMEDPRQSPPPQLMIFKNGEWQRNPKVHDHHPPNASFGSRLGRALLSVVWTHYDSGRDFIAFSRVGGAFASGLVGLEWTPDRQNTWGQVGIRTGTAFGGYAGGAIFREFQPDITKLLSKIVGQRKTPSP
jgi:hypothetical protein